MVLVGLLVLTAGCSAFGGDGDAGASPTPESNASPATDDSTPTETPPTETPTPENETDDHSHDGDDDNGTAPESNDTVTSTDGNDSDAATGKLTIVVAGADLDLKSLDEEGDGFGIASDEQTWVSRQSGLTLAEALTRFDIEASTGTLTFNGETYQQETEGTDISYRVNGEPVDPESHEVTDGDRIWVLVTTDDMNASTPGTYIRRAQQHVHGPMTMTVEGDTVDFSREKYQSNDRYFHFEGGSGEEWHAHSWSITLEYALSSLEGINVTGTTLTYEGTTYDPDDPGTTVTFEVNGEPVEPDEYFLKDGDSVRVVVETDEG